MQLLEYRFFGGASGIAELRDDWRQLQARVPGCKYFQTCEWHRAILHHLLDDTKRSFYIGAYCPENTLQAVFPLRWTSVRLMGVRAHVLGFNWHSHALRHDFLVDPAHEDAIKWRTLLHCVESQLGVRFDRIDLRGAPESSSVNRIFGRKALFGRTPPKTDGCAIIDCRGTFEENTSRLPARALRNIRRLERRARRRGKVEFSKLRGHIPAETLAEFIAIEDDGWKGVRGTSILKDRDLQGFYASLVADADEHHPCQINRLSVAGKPVAAQFGFVSGGIFHILKIGYRQGSADIGPGNLLMKSAVEDASRSDYITAIDLLTAPHWTKNWATSTESSFSYSIYRPTACGCVMFATALLRRLASPLRRTFGRPDRRSKTRPRRFAVGRT